MYNLKIEEMKIFLILLLVLIVLLFVQNFHLGKKVDEAIYQAENAEYQARQAKEYAKSAANGAFLNNCKYCP